jgi:DNA helicase-2/ATP-dependent DNA helicase PcrA
MEDLISKLNPVQQKIVKDTEGQVLTLAGAGAGKTRVLTHRIAYLLHNQVKPWQILAVTFTNKAAREMKERVVNLVGTEGRDVWVGTFHGICVRILRRFGDQIGLNNFVIIDEKERTKLLKKASEQCGLEYDIDMIVGVIGTAKNDLLSPMELLSLAKRQHEKDIAHIYEAYEQLKAELQYVDFDDLIMKTVHLLRVCPEARDTYQKQFRYVLADEGQDTNEAQYTLLDLLTAEHMNLFVVADVDQSIYKWRGAKVSNMIKFQEKYPESRLYKLEQNYRSTSTIVGAANGVIEKNTERIEKTAWTENQAGAPIILYQADDDGREADFVASAIRRLMDVEKKSHKDFAVLYRMNRQSRAMEVALIQADLKYQIVGGTSFYDRKEIKDLTAYLRLISNEYDALAMERIINVPRRGIGDTTIKKIEDYANACMIPFPKAVENIEHIDGIAKGTKTKIEAFITFVNELREYAFQENQTVANIILETLRRTNYREQFNAEKDDDVSRIENLEELVNVADAWDKGNEEGKTIIDFLTETTLASDIDDMDDDDKIRLMTVHASKGLEFPVVFLIGCEENVFPHGRSMSDPLEIEEERRGMYVAMTRPEERLFITHCRQRYEYNDPRPKASRPSRFIGEIPKQFVKRMG